MKAWILVAAILATVMVPPGCVKKVDNAETIQKEERPLPTPIRPSTAIPTARAELVKRNLDAKYDMSRGVILKSPLPFAIVAFPLLTTTKNSDGELPVHCLVYMNILGHEGERSVDEIPLGSKVPHVRFDKNGKVVGYERK